MDADQIREEISGLAQIRAGLEERQAEELNKVRDAQAKVLKKADACRGMTMSEAIELSGLSRPTVYELLKRIS